MTDAEVKAGLPHPILPRLQLKRGWGFGSYSIGSLAQHNTSVQTQAVGEAIEK